MKILLLTLSIGGIPYPAGLSAQDNQLTVIEDIRQSEAWLTSENASGLQYLPMNTISSAEVFMDKKNGPFINYFQSDNSIEWGGGTESYRRLNRNVVFYGSMVYRSYTGQNMGGSVFIDPYYNAFDIVEGIAGSEGEKNLEKYELTGAVGIKLTPRWALGAKIDYTAADYAKHKDLRHENMFLNINASAGFSFRFNSRFEAGLNYFYRRSVEGLLFSVYGTTDKQYNSLISFGSFYGRTERFGESGYTNSNTNKPTFNEFNGVSFQADWKLSDNWRFFNELSCKSREGYYGNRSSSTPVYTRHNAENRAYSGVFSFKNIHFIHLDVENESLENYENIFVKETQPGGKTDILYYGSNKVINRDLLHAQLEYSFLGDVKNFHPEWTLKAGIDFHERSQTTSLYPDYRKQIIRILNFRIYAEKEIIRRKNAFGLSADLQYGSGSGKAKEDGLYATPSESRKEPQSSDYYLYREYEYLTAPKIAFNPEFTCSRLFDKLNIRGYISVNYNHTRAIDVSLLGNHFQSFSLKAGCLF
jgi:hypothetical protein